MINSDFSEFTKIMDALSDYYQQREPLKPVAVKIYFNALMGYPIDSVRSAVSMHVQNTKSGRFYPKASDLIQNLQITDRSWAIPVIPISEENIPKGVLTK